MLLAVYAATMAPGVTFWDAGEFIAAAHGFGIPHPPGTPLFVAIGRVWTMILGPLLGVARASNLLSATCTAVAGGLAAALLLRELGNTAERRWGILSAVMCAGLGTSVWANATETEVYAASLLLVMLTLVSAQRVASSEPHRARRWLLLTGYLIALAPALHLSALVGAPAAIMFATAHGAGRERWSRGLLLGGVLVMSAGIGTMSPVVGGAGVALLGAGLLVDDGPHRAATAWVMFLLVCIGASALTILLLRARQNPLLDQGHPATFTSLADVVARRQYDAVPPLPRRAPVWLQLAQVAQYADWQFGMGLGNGIFTTPLRVVTMCAFLILGVAGWKRMRADAARLARALLVLAVCGTLGVCVYLNLKAGASIGYGLVPSDAHEARERDYFFVLGFWAWGLFAGYGACAFAIARRKSPRWSLVAVAIPLVANWSVNDRARGVEATAARVVAHALLEHAPRDAVLFLAGDNDTYPLWYLQQVEGFRTDVTAVTLPLLPADWYYQQLAERGHLQHRSDDTVPPAELLHELRAAQLSAAARRTGRPVAVTTQVSAADRGLLGSAWTLDGAVYVASGPPASGDGPPFIPPGRDSATGAEPVFKGRRTRLPDDVSQLMLASLSCGRLSAISGAKSPLRDSLETRCNLR